jgi:hypothetical protein
VKCSPSILSRFHIRTQYHCLTWQSEDDVNQDYKNLRLVLEVCTLAVFRVNRYLYAAYVVYTKPLILSGERLGMPRLFDAVLNGHVLSLCNEELPGRVYLTASILRMAQTSKCSAPRHYVLKTGIRIGLHRTFQDECSLAICLEF